MNSADLYQPIHAQHPGTPPLVLRTIISSQDYIAGGMPASSKKVENYILLSALPVELQERVRTAVHALISGM